MMELINRDGPGLRAFKLAALFLIAALPVFGQYGPMGFGNADGTTTYPQQPKLFLWLDGSDVSYNGSNVVTQWNDKSGNGQHFVAATGSNILYSSNTGPANTPCVIFDGGSNSRLVSENFQMPEGGYSVYFVLRTNDNRFGLFSYAQSNANPYEFVIHGDGADIKQRHGANERTTNLLGLTNNSWAYGGIMWQNNDEILWEHHPTNQTEATNNAFSNGFSITSGGTAVIGQFQNSLNGGFSTDSAFTGSIAEIFIFEGRLNRAQTRLMRTYLIAKYGFGLPGGNPGWNKFGGALGNVQGVHYEPIGIGRDLGGGTNNPGQHFEARSRGLVLNIPLNNTFSNQRYLCAAPIGTDVNSLSTQGLSTVTDVTQRWNNVWTISTGDAQAGKIVRVGFDFSEGYPGGLFPQNESGYRLIRRTNPTSGNFTVVNVSAQYIVDDQIVFEVDHGILSENGYYYTLSTTDISSSSLTGAPVRTWHAFETGAWNNPNTWTLDGSAAPSYINPGGEIPGEGDFVNIGSGRTVTMNISNVNLSGINCSGVLDLVSTAGHNFGNIAGNGRIRLRSNGANDNFPLGGTTQFADPDLGGVVEFYGAVDFTLDKSLTLNRMVVNLNSSARVLTLNGDLILNGDLTITRGTLKVNGDSGGDRRTIVTNNDVRVELNGHIRVGNQNFASTSNNNHNRGHDWYFYGDLINFGTAYFTNRDAEPTDYNAIDNTGLVNCIFVNSTKNQLVQCNGVTRFSRIEINKGSNDTYILKIAASAANRFFLYGWRGQNGPGVAGGVSEILWTNNRNAFALINGTAEIGRFVTIPQLYRANDNYNINSTAQLWVNGGSVIRTGGIAVVVYGIIRVSGGSFKALSNSGVTTRGNGTLIVEHNPEVSPTVTDVEIWQLRTSIFGPDQIGGYIQTGGNVKILGRTDGGISNTYAPFTLSSPGNIFTMTGGTLTIKGGNDRGLIFINSDPEQVNVSGGTIIAEVNTNSTQWLRSRAPFYNLNIRKTTGDNRPVRISGGTVDGETISDVPLRVLNNLSITDDATLSTESGSGVRNDVYVGGNFSISNAATYDHGLNSTYFNGLATSTIQFNTTLRTFHNLVIDKNQYDRFVNIQSGNTALAISVQGEFRLEKGEFRNGSRHVEFLGSVTNRGIFGTETATGVAIFNGSSQQELTSDRGVFHSMQVNNLNGVRLLNDDLVIKRELTLTNGIFYIGEHKLILDGPNSSINASPLPTSRFIATSGNPSAGGLEAMIKTNATFQEFPIGVEDGLSVKLTPARIQINTPSNTEGYIQIVPVDDVLSSTNTDVGDNFLNFYWRVAQREFDNVPMVSHRFTYQDSDVIGLESGLASGRVLSDNPDNPFERQVDSLNVFNDHVNTTNQEIFYNGTEASGLNGPGTLLVDASYSAGDAIRFEGRPRVFYSIDDALDAEWDDPGNWSELGQFSSGAGPFQFHSSANSPNPGGLYPQAGDIAFIGFNPATGRPHHYRAPVTENITAAEIRFTRLQNAAGEGLPRYYAAGEENVTVLRPTLNIQNTAKISSVKQISGEGALLLQTDVDLGATDVGAFLSEESSIIIIRPTESTPLTLNNLPSNIPNLFLVTNSESGQSNLTFVNNTFIRGDFELVGSVNASISTGASGNITVSGDLITESYQFSSALIRIRFPNSGPSKTLTVLGDLLINGNGSAIEVFGPNAGGTVHNLVVHQNIFQNAPASAGLNLFNGTNAVSYINLTVAGPGNHAFENIAGNAPKLARLIVDKGLNTASSFSFDSLITLGAPTDQPEKVVDLRNGLIKFNNDGIDITLSSGAQGDFLIPPTAGIELNAGTLRVNGNSGTGLFLDGLLKLTGGEFLIGSVEGSDNFLEYTGSSNAEIDISGGSLVVGSQLRRGLTNTAGILKYYQSGGEVVVGRYAAPNPNRGVFEITNTNSVFEHTGGEITLVRGNNSSSFPALLITPNPANVQIGPGSSVNIGAPSSIGLGSSVSNIGIQSAEIIENLVIRNSASARLFTLPLTVNNLLEISSGSGLDADGRALTLNLDFDNDGTFVSNGGALILNHTSGGEISGIGSFTIGDLLKTGGGLTVITAVEDMLVLGNLTIGSGITQCDFATLTVQGTIAEVDGDLLFGTTSNGLVLAGTGAQILRRSGAGISSIDLLTIDNTAGVSMNEGAGYVFEINQSLRLSRGVFGLNGNLLRLSAVAEIEEINSFGSNNMITTEGSFTQFGVEKIIAANRQTDYILPIGLLRYTPVTFNFGFVNDLDPSDFNTSGNQELTLLVSAINGFHPTVIDFPPQNNALNMHWSINAENIGSGFRTGIEFHYDQDYVELGGGFTESDYEPIRVFNQNEVGDPPSFVTQKFGTELVDEINNIITFQSANYSSNSLSGEYFAGVDEAVLDAVPEYETTRNGDVTEGQGVGPANGVYNVPTEDGFAPRGAAVFVKSGHTLRFEVSDINFYSTSIESGAVVEIDNTSRHRLGKVTGEGTLRIISDNEVATIPNGNYNEFFPADCIGGGTLEYSGAGSYNIMGNLPIVPRLILSGSGDRYLANNDITICEDFVVNGPLFFNSNDAQITVQNDLIIESGSFSSEHGDINILNHLSINGGSFISGSQGVRTIHGNAIVESGGNWDLGSGGRNVLLSDFYLNPGASINGGSGFVRTVFEGNSTQSMFGDFTGMNSIFALEINNADSLNLEGNVDITSLLYLTDGLINTKNSAKIRFVDHTAVSVPVRGRPNSFVNGPLDRILGVVGSDVSYFPVGKNSRWRSFGLSNTSAPRTWTVQYFDTIATLEPGVTLDVVDPIIETISLQEYWKVNSNSVNSTFARVWLSWGENSAVGPPEERDKLVAMVWNVAANPLVWSSFGGDEHMDDIDGIPNTGSFGSETSALVPFTEKLITLGSSSPFNPLPVTFLHFDGTTDGENHTLRWATASETNNDFFELERSSDGRHFVAIARIDGAGNTVTRQDYAYIDTQAPMGRVYYRLRQVDFNGDYDYAQEIVTLVRDQDLRNTLDFLLYPNPTSHGYVRIQAAELAGEFVQVAVSDLSGRIVVKRLIWIDDSGLSDELSLSLGSGMYVVSMLHDGMYKSKPLIVTK